MSTRRGKLRFRSFLHLFSDRHLRLTLVLIIIVAISGFPRQVSTAQVGWQWYKTDTHIHSSTSADTYIDLGILSNRPKPPDITPFLSLTTIWPVIFLPMAWPIKFPLKMLIFIGSQMYTEPQIPQ